MVPGCFLRYSLLAWAAAAAFGSGCAAVPYNYAKFADVLYDAPVLIDGVLNKHLDRVAWLVAWPSRLVPLHSKVNNHHISD